MSINYRRQKQFVYEIDCIGCEAVYLSEFKPSSKPRLDEQKRPVKNCDCEKNEIAKHCCEANIYFSWDQKTVVDRESRLITRKILGTNSTLVVESRTTWHTVQPKT